MTKTESTKKNLSIITPVFVPNKDAAKRLANRMETYANYLNWYQGEVEWIVLVDLAHSEFKTGSKGLSDPVFKVIHTPTEKLLAQPLLKNIGIQLAESNTILIMDQDMVIPPVTLQEVFNVPVGDDILGIFSYYQGGILRPEPTTDLMLFRKTEKGPFFDERFIGYKGDKEAFMLQSNLQIMRYSMPAQRIVDNYYNQMSFDAVDSKHLIEKIDREQLSPQVTDKDKFFKELTNVHTEGSESTIEGPGLVSGLDEKDIRRRQISK